MENIEELENKRDEDETPELFEWVNDVLSDDEYKVTIQIMPNGTIIPHPDKYKPEYDQIAYEVMSKENGTLANLSVALRCGRPTLNSWIKRHKSLKRAVDNGKINGEKKFLNKVAENAFLPSKNVNNGLIKMVAQHRYGIRFDDPQVVINNSNKQENTTVETGNLYRKAIGREEGSEDF